MCVYRVPPSIHTLTDRNCNGFIAGYTEYNTTDVCFEKTGVDMTEQQIQFYIEFPANSSSYPLPVHASVHKRPTVPQQHVGREPVRQAACEREFKNLLYAAF